MTLLFVGGPEHGFNHELCHPLPVLHEIRDEISGKSHTYRRDTVAHGNKTITIIYVWEGEANCKSPQSIEYVRRELSELEAKIKRGPG